MAMEIAYFTREEVSKNHGKGGVPVWIIYKDSVYNLTEFLYEHPGGAELIYDEGGRDATKAFNSAGHSSDAKNMLRKYKVGELYESERNGPVKKKIAMNGTSDGSTNRSFLNIVTCGLMG